MADWSKPTTSSLYTDFPTEIKDRDNELARGLDPNACSPYPSNLPANSLRWLSSALGANYKLQWLNGSTWTDCTALAMSITGSAATLTNTRTFAITGDGTATAQNFNGSANVSLSLTLSTVAVAKGGTSYSSYAVGDMLYASGTGALSKLGIGSSGQVMTSSGTAPQWVAQSSLAVGSATTATTATNLAGGGAGQIPYQNSAGQTYMLAAGAAEYILKSNGAGAPSWVAQSTLSVGTAAACSGNAATATNASQLGGTAAANYLQVGKQTIWIPAGSMQPRITNGPSTGLVETTTNKVMVSTLDFDYVATNEYAQFQIRMPKSWNEGTLTATFLWSNASGTGNVVWGIQAVALSDDDAIDATFGTAVTVQDAVTAAGDMMQTSETSAMTVGGSPVAGDLVVFQVYRNASDTTNDTLGVDARLHGVTLFYTTDAANDA
jgi:hypothetical protein